MNRCSICTGQFRCCPGDGPADARYFMIGERPGQMENKIGRVFIGDAGQENDRLYLPLAGLDRSECYYTNAVKCGSERNKKPTGNEIAVCAGHHLPTELELVNPFLVVLMGASACSLVDGIDLDAQHGIPFKGSLFGWLGWIVPMFHPAAGMHNTGLMIPLMDDWKRLSTWLQRPVEHESVVETTDYRIADSGRAVLEYFSDYGSDDPYVGGDSESHDRKDFSIQISLKVNTGLLVYEDDESTKRQLARCLGQKLIGGYPKVSLTMHRNELILHNAPADLRQFSQLLWKYFDVPEFRYRDTQQESYHFQNLPQKLKSLAYRLLHKRRRSWDEVVGPPSRMVLRDWLLDAVVKAEGDAQVIPRAGKRGQPIKPEIIKSEYEGKLRGILTHLSKSETYDPWKRITVEMDEKFGRVPRKGVKWVPPDELKDYGCQDASDALELALLFDRMREAIVKKEWHILPEDCDQIVLR